MSDTLTEARELLDQQKFQEALELLHTVDEVNSIVKTSIARALSGLGRWEQAHSLFSEIIQQDEECHEALAGRGLLYFLTGNFQKAGGDYSKAIEGAPMNGRYHGLMGVLLAQLGNGPQALKALESAFDLGCTDPSFMIARAQIHLATRNQEKAEEALAMADKHGGDEATVAALEGALAMLKGDPKEALASYRFSVEKDPQAVNNWMNLLTLTAKLDRPRLLEEALKALEAHPDSEELIQVVVGAYREAGNPKQAFQVLKDAIERNPQSPLLYFQMGLGLAYSEKFEEAAEQFTKALEIAPRFPRALDARGNCYERLGKKEDAQADFEKSHEIRKEDAEKMAVQQQMVPPTTNGAD